MATYTTNYNLEKPAQTDIYNVDVFNANADKIDAGLTDKAEKTMLAPVETTNSASRSYAKGEYFVYNNVLCCATTAIAAGGTIAIGTNCSTAPVGGELKSLRDALTYKLAYDGSDMTAKTLPTGWSEALVWVSVSASSGVLYNFHVLAASPMTQVVGYQMAQAGFTYAQITSSNTAITFDDGMYQNARYTPKRWVIWYK